MPSIDFGRALREARNANPAAMPDILARSATAFGATDLVVYLVDFSRTVLEPMPNGLVHADAPGSEELATTMAGRAFNDQQIVTAHRHDHVRVWIPVVEGSDRTGVIALSLPRVDDDVLAACVELGIVAGYLIAVHARSTDVYDSYRRRRSMSLAASMQWDILPPLVLAAGGVSAGVRGAAAVAVHRTDRDAIAADVGPQPERSGTWPKNGVSVLNGWRSTMDPRFP